MVCTSFSGKNVNKALPEVVMQGNLIAVAYTLRTYWVEFLNKNRCISVYRAEFVNMNRCISVRLVSEEVKSIRF